MATIRQIWDTTTGKELRTLNGHNRSVYSLAVLSNNTLASGSGDYTIKLWDTNSGKLLKTLNGHKNWVRSLVVLPDKTLASGSEDKTIKIWDTLSGNLGPKLTKKSL